MDLTLDIDQKTLSLGGIAIGGMISSMKAIYGDLHPFKLGDQQMFGALENRLQVSVLADGVIDFIEAFGPDPVRYQSENVIGMARSRILARFGRVGATRTVGSDDVTYLHRGFGFQVDRGRVVSVFCFRQGYYDGYGLTYEPL